jgi:MoxR-like ATPase
VQCTADLLPADVVGTQVFNQREGRFEFRPGPVFANVVLVDEINRAMPKTQSALLEAMAERQVTVDGVTHALPDPFLVLATENPIEQEGTFPLPEAQLDRFFLKTELGYPTVNEEIEIVREQRAQHPLEALEPVVSVDAIRELEAAIEDIYTDDLLLRWIVELVTVTRDIEPVALGASVRASLALERTARAWALLQGRDFVTPEDVETLFLPVIGHRVIFTPTFVAENRELGRDGALNQFRDLVFSRVTRPEPSDERELKVLSGYS